MFRNKQVSHELDEELNGFLEMAAEEKMKRGMTRKDALRSVRLERGSLELTKEVVRSAGWESFVEMCWQDLRFGLRVLRKSLGFTTVAILTLALGIGANTAIFSLVNEALLRPLPFAESDQLVHIFSTRAGALLEMSPLDARDLANENHTFEGMALHDAWRKAVSGLPDTAEGEQQNVGIVQSQWFDLLRVKPLIGNVWTPDNDQPGRNYVVALGEHFWRERFHGDPRAIGRIIKINDEGYTIIGVVPEVGQPWFYANVELWTPFVPYPELWEERNRGNRGYSVLGRLKPDVSIAQARSDLNTLATSLAQRYPADREIAAGLRPLRELRGDGSQRVLFLFSAAVGLILLIACANLANLLLARNATRQREFAVRAAIGAARGTLIRTLFMESLLLSVAGGALAIVVAVCASAGLSRLHTTWSLTQLASMHIDWRVLSFTTLVCLVTTGLFATLPAIAGTRLNLIDALRNGGRSEAAGRRGERLRRMLVISELALSLMLLMSAGLLVRSIANMQNQDLGFDRDRMLTARFILPISFRLQRTDSASFISRFTDEFSQRVMALPGVRNVTISASAPPDEGWRQTFTIDRHPAQNISEVPETRFNVVDWRYCSTIGDGVVRGRDFTATDTEFLPPVALINETLARRFFPTEDPLGQRIHLGPPENFLSRSPGEDAEIVRFTIVGVIRDIRNNGLALPTEPEIIALFRQTPTLNYGFKRVTLRTSIPPQGIAMALRREFRALNPDVPLTDLMTMDERVSELVADNRFATILLGVMAGLGVLLATVGTYGVVSYLVAQRTQEFGVRLALGASPTQVLWITLRKGLSMALIGSVVGLAGAVLAERSITRFLYGVGPFDPPTIFCSALLLLFVSVLASLIPAWRAMRVDPMVALRYE